MDQFFGHIPSLCIVACSNSITKMAIVACLHSRTTISPLGCVLRTGLVTLHLVLQIS